MNETILKIGLVVLFLWCSSLSGEIHSLKKQLKK